MAPVGVLHFVLFAVRVRRALAAVAGRPLPQSLMAGGSYPGAGAGGQDCWERVRA